MFVCCSDYFEYVFLSLFTCFNSSNGINLQFTKMATPRKQETKEGLQNRVDLICCPTLKVPKREIFDRSDFPDFYTIKSLRVGDFGVKIKKP
jgi:hypothetical protein